VGRREASRSSFWRVEATPRSAFVDLSIKPRDKSLIREMCRNAITLGFSALGLTLDPSATPEEMGAVKSMVADFEPQLEVFTRAEIAPRKRRSLLNMLSQVRNRFEVVSVRCVSNEVALVAARDRRVDSVLFPCDGNLRMSAGVASICRNLLEVELQPLIMDQGERRRRCFLLLSQDLRMALAAGLPVAVSSGARDLLQQRSPLALSSILAALGVGGSEAAKAMGSLVISRLQANRRKLSHHYLEDGVAVAKRPSC